MATQEEIIRFLVHYVADWPRDDPLAAWPRCAYRLHPQVWPRTMADRFTVEEIAQKLLERATADVLRLGTLMGTPEGQAIAAIVGAFAPPLYRTDIDLLVNALTLAAKTQQKDAWRQLLIKLGIGTAAGVAVAVVVRGSTP